MNFLLKGWNPCLALGWKTTTEINFPAEDEDDAWKIVKEQHPHIQERRLFREVEPTK
ncbi:MAG: hypothetical protein UW81_C0006G0022 [Candidatus Giovannonibacteria bacterium GW2011_GWC2_44_9]|uniref:Uncharacterized protein n=3 Tax=Candidatus Giovannoniibacteriota TaxID=1752738 RepID=A0A0G1IX29_9BACT|nr:MAG: hypothetical protein UW49_C0004G0067 [Candidatus Giovannonibacteria bacterium GW2011_GWB1_44_23]KKT63956.1 MAG: hypothetical protein UW57_C0004G0066 [Candidatus Giovannonibacteria bacterium GW2011_GWA1_44_29]KKT84097.1 MAG: hypothetical protein UW81_C0006G0022 [Candidatus Giovannonibacteria bacterium GW2011_GWC2_44_9]KKT91669.1 MAG: hypothetical protein UW93_C0004G0067 [Parcubacteria group bacterium GW2011_GWC1_45_13]